MKNEANQKVEFKKLLDNHCEKVFYCKLPSILTDTLYEAYLKFPLEIKKEDFIKKFFIHIKRGKGLFIDKKV